MVPSKPSRAAGSRRPRLTSGELLSTEEEICSRQRLQLTENDPDGFLADRIVEGLSTHGADAVGQLRGIGSGKHRQRRNSRLNVQPPVRGHRDALTPRAEGHEML